MDQEGLFNESGIIELLDMALSGSRVCAFAFGQTGAGKTYTMLGNDNTPHDDNNNNNSSSSSTSSSRGVGGNEVGDNSGLLARSLSYIFDKSSRHNNTNSNKVVVRLSCIEVSTYE